MLDVCLLGTSGMVPLKNRWLTSFYVLKNGHAVLIDCGEGTQIAISEAGLKLKPIDTICLTHYHADHIAGLPGLLLSMSNSGRTEDVTIIGPPGTTQVVTSLLIIAPVLNFEILLCETDGVENATMESNGIQINAFAVDHVVPCVGYTLNISRNPKFNPLKAEELGIPKQYWATIQKGSSIKLGDKIITPEDILGEPRKGIKVLYSTDTRPVPSIVENGKDADLMVLEGIYGSNLELDKAIMWGHSTMVESAYEAVQANTKELWLTHFSQSITDPEEYAETVKRIFPNTIIGKDGMKKKITFEE